MRITPEYSPASQTDRRALERKLATQMAEGLDLCRTIDLTRAEIQAMEPETQHQ